MSMSKRAATKKSTTAPVNVGFGVEYARAMVDLRSSSAASRHKDRHAEGRKGYGKGGRSGARQALRAGRGYAA